MIGIPFLNGNVLWINKQYIASILIDNEESVAEVRWNPMAGECVVNKYEDVDTYLLQSWLKKG